MANPEDFLRTFDTSMKYLGLDYVDLLSLHGINNRQLLDWSVGGKEGTVAAARKMQREGRCRFRRFFHATTDIILDAVNSNEFDYFNVHWYFVNDLNWPAIEAATRLDMGVFIIANDKGGKLYDPPCEKLVELMAAVHAHAVQWLSSAFASARPTR